MPPPKRIDAEHPRRDAAVQFLLDRVDYERWKSIPYGRRVFKLDRMRQLLDELGNPQQGMPLVHIAGTKGKGSTTAMVRSVLSAAGYHCGAFTSPHLDRVEQRITVDGQCCTGDDLAEMVEQIKPVVAELDRLDTQRDAGERGPTYFEVVTALALMHFAERKVDVAVLEVGLGGRLDSTNVCTPCVSVITSISYDHTQQLGDRLESIAREKAGIVKPGVPVVSGVVDDAPREVIRNVCSEHGCSLVERDVDFDFRYTPPQHLEQAPTAGRLDFHIHSGETDRRLAGLELNMLGEHQAANAAVALATIEQLRGSGWAISDDAIRRGLAAASSPARIEVLSRLPAIIVDMAHNAASMAATVRTVQESFSVRRRRLVFATTQEKDLSGMLDACLGAFDEIVFTRYLENPRAVEPSALAELARRRSGREFPVFDDPADALTAVRARSTPEDLICIAGSVFLAAELRRRLLSEASRRPQDSNPTRGMDDRQDSPQKPLPAKEIP